MPPSRPGPAALDHSTTKPAEGPGLFQGAGPGRSQGYSRPPAVPCRYGHHHAIRQRPPPSRRSHPDDSPERIAAAAPGGTWHPAHPPVGRRPCRGGTRVPGRGARRPGRPLPPPGGPVTDPVPPPLPPAPPAAHLPLWAVITIVAATAVLSVATTLITLSLEHRHRARRTPAAAGPRPTCNPRQPRRNPRPGRATSSAATSTRPAMTCTGPTAGKGPAPLRQPPGVILNGRRTASPSATWRTIRAPASSACRTTGRDQDVVMKASRAEVSDSATPDVRSRAATSWAAGLSQQRLRRRDHLAPVILHRPRPRAVRHHQPLNPHPVPPLIGCGKP